MAGWLEKLKKFFSDVAQEPQQQECAQAEVNQQQEAAQKPQKKEPPKKRKIYTFDDLKFDYDGYSVYADRGVSLASSLRFDNGYRMCISYKSFVDDYLYSTADFKKYEAPAGYKIKIYDSKDVENNTCLNKDGQSIYVCTKKEVTQLMKQIQLLDENGNLPTVDMKAKIEARKKHIQKARDLRKERERHGSADTVSGAVIADNIAQNVISGKEQRPITQEVVAEYKKQALRDK